MNVSDAIQKLITRNQNHVAKHGVSDYSRESDKIINALLKYYHDSEANWQRVVDMQYRIEVFAKYIKTFSYLYDSQIITVDTKTLIGMDVEFLDRAFNVFYDLDVDGVVLDLPYLIAIYKSRCTIFAQALDEYHFIKENPKVKKYLEESNQMKELCDYVNSGMTEKEVYDDMRQKILFQNL